MKKSEVVKKIKSILEYLGGESGYVNAIYRTPAQSLRYQADEIERKEKTIKAFIEWFIEFEKSEE